MVAPGSWVRTYVRVLCFQCSKCSCLFFPGVAGGSAYAGSTSPLGLWAIPDALRFSHLQPLPWMRIAPKANLTMKTSRTMQLMTTRLQKSWKRCLGWLLLPCRLRDRPKSDAEALAR